MNSRAEKLEAFGRLLDIMDTLRAECPWDKKQTMDTLSYLTIEETYELVDAISDKNLNGPLQHGNLKLYNFEKEEEYEKCAHLKKMIA